MGRHYSLAVCSCSGTPERGPAVPYWPGGAAPDGAKSLSVSNQQSTPRDAFLGVRPTSSRRLPVGGLAFPGRIHLTMTGPTWWSWLSSAEPRVWAADSRQPGRNAPQRAQPQHDDCTAKA